MQGLDPILEFNKKKKLGDKLKNFLTWGIYNLSSVINFSCSEDFKISKPVSMAV